MGGIVKFNVSSVKRQEQFVDIRLIGLAKKICRTSSLILHSCSFVDRQGSKQCKNHSSWIFLAMVTTADSLQAGLREGVGHFVYSILDWN